jgi:hypothetical protein
MYVLGGQSSVAGVELQSITSRSRGSLPHMRFVFWSFFVGPIMPVVTISSGAPNHYQGMDKPAMNWQWRDNNITLGITARILIHQKTLP